MVPGSASCRTFGLQATTPTLLGPRLYDHLPALVVLAAASYCVADLDVLDREALEDLSHLRVVVDGEDRLAFHGPHVLGHEVVLLDAEGDAVTFGLPVRRVQEEECAGPVVLLDALLPVEVLDVTPGQPHVGLAQVLLDPGEVESGRTRGCGAEGAAVDLPSEGHLLQVEEPRGSLNIG